VKVLGINAIYHDPAAALVVDGKIVAAAEEERFSRRKHGKRPVPFAAWELPELSMRWCLDRAGLRPEDWLNLCILLAVSFLIALITDSLERANDALSVALTEPPSSDDSDRAVRGGQRGWEP